MKRAAVLALACLTSVVLLSLVDFTSEIGEAQHSTHLGQNSKPQVDGDINPNQISDSAAYEVLFRMLATSDGDPDGMRKQAYLRLSGFNGAESSAISFAAHEYRRRIATLDEQVNIIKDQTWPAPSQQAMSQLAQLQRKKETIISEVVATLQNQLRNYDLGKFKNHIDNKVKKRMKGYQPELPTRKVSGIKKFIPTLFAVSASAQGACGNGYVYAYSDTAYDANNAKIYGYGSYSAPYDSCGHEYIPTTVTTGPDGIQSGGDLFTEINLVANPDNAIDGDFDTEVVVEIFCPIIYATYFAAEALSSDSVLPYVRLNPYTTGFTPSSVTVDHTSEISISVTTSQRYAGSVGLEFSYVPVSGQAPIHIIIGGGGDYRLASGRTTVFSASYTPVQVTSAVTTVKAHVMITSYPGATVSGPSERTSTSILTINR